ncbi:MAG: hypothetical protein ACI9UK_001249, partial [Candidatus Krumholzibacteriia bacterium]
NLFAVRTPVDKPTAKVLPPELLLKRFLGSGHRREKWVSISAKQFLTSPSNHEFGPFRLTL